MITGDIVQKEAPMLYENHDHVIELLYSECCRRHSALRQLESTNSARSLCHKIQDRSMGLIKHTVAIQANREFSDDSNGC